jgi:predicted nuclease of predicted toxin-antitoxin system
MELKNYSFLTDENINPLIVQSLRVRGCDVFDVKEQQLQGNSDTFLLTLATQQNRVVLTHDSDFGTLVIADGKPFIGIVYLKPGHILPQFTLQSLEVVFNEIDFIENPFIIVAKNNGITTKVRVRQF